jgi:hypothetical protein
MKVKDDFFREGSFKIGNVVSTRFLEDTWLGDTPLSHQYASLYNIVQRENVSVANVLSHSPLNIEFRRAFLDNRWAMDALGAPTHGCPTNRI